MAYLILMLANSPEDVKDLVSSKDRIIPIQGVYLYPDNPPTCRGLCGKRKISGWGRKPDKGFMVHDCGKRHPDWRARVTGVLFDNLGRNLLKNPHHWFKNPETW